MKSMNKKESKKIATIAAVIVGLMMFAFMPLASAKVTSFVVTPSSGIAGLVDSYDVLVTTDGVTSINVSIPEGFIGVTPATGGVQIARIDFWNSSTKAYYGYATFTANDTNPTTEIDAYCELGGVTARTTQTVNYTPGATNTFVSNVGGNTASVITKLPTEDDTGSIEITINSTAFYLDDVSINIGEFVRNPRCLSACDYAFIADGEIAWVSITVPVGRGAVFRDGMWYADTDGDHQTDIWYRYGIPGDIPAVGDIDNNGINDIIAFRNGWWYVSREDHTGTNVGKTFVYGIPGDIPLIGDIDNDGTEDAVIFRGGWWYVCNDTHAISTETNWTKSFEYGNPGDIPVLADVDNDCVDDVVIFRNGWWYVSDAATHTTTVDSFKYGIPGDKPIVDDIRNDGSNDIAVLRDGRWYVSRPNFSGTDYSFMYGIPGDVPILNKFFSA